jgi:hypothetical protein
MMSFWGIDVWAGIALGYLLWVTAEAEDGVEATEGEGVG